MTKFIIFSFIAVLSLASCDVDQTQKAELPDVDVKVGEGQLPKFDVNWADVNVGTRTETIKVPKIKVVMEEEEVEIPYVDVDMPNSGDKEELTLAVEADVRGTMKDLEIQEVYATDNRLYVVSTLEDSGEDLGGEIARVSDHLVLNAPEDLNVKHIIIGERPKGAFNRQFRYVSSRSDISNKLSGGKQIYKKS